MKFFEKILWMLKKAVSDTISVVNECLLQIPDIERSLSQTRQQF